MLRGEASTVVGVMPDGFHTGVPADVTPLRPSTTGEGGGENYHVLVRVREAHAWSQQHVRSRARARNACANAPRLTVPA
jgi:hypothetical protein